MASTDEDLSASVRTQLRIRDNINAVSDMVNRIEWMRKQLEDVQKMLRLDRLRADLLKSVEEIDKKMQDLEYKLISKSDRTSDDKYYVEAYKLYLNLIWLNGEVGTGAGDVAGGADFRPTEASLGVLEMLETELAKAQADYRNLMEKEVPAFNRLVAEKGITPLAAGGSVDSAAPNRRP